MFINIIKKCSVKAFKRHIWHEVNIVHCKGISMRQPVIHTISMPRNLVAVHRFTNGRPAQRIDRHAILEKRYA